MVRPSLEVVLVALIPLGGCGEAQDQAPPRRCQVAVTMGAGSASATVVAEPAEEAGALRRRAVRAGCTALCAADPKPAACAARCEVDVQAKKAGARVECTPPLR